MLVEFKDFPTYCLIQWSSKLSYCKIWLFIGKIFSLGAKEINSNGILVKFYLYPNNSVGFQNCNLNLNLLQNTRVNVRYRKWISEMIGETVVSFQTDRAINLLYEMQKAMLKILREILSFFINTLYYKVANRHDNLEEDWLTRGAPYLKIPSLRNPIFNSTKNSSFPDVD